MSRQGGDMRSSVGVDVGGTFTDLVAREGSGRLRACKVPTTPANLARGVLNGLAAVRPAAGVPASVAHGTTVVTNAIVERRGARVGLVTTRGFRDVLEIARQSRLHLYDLRLPPKPEPLVERRLRLEVGERVGPDGAVPLPLALDELPAIVEAFERGHVESVAVCLLHSYANPAHERALKAALAPHFAHLSVSSEINAEFREYERSSTTVLNAAVMPLASRYLDELVTALGREARGAVLHLLHSAGGMMSAAAARARPLAMAASGPAAGMAAAAAGRRRPSPTPPLSSATSTPAAPTAARSASIPGGPRPPSRAWAVGSGSRSSRRRRAWWRSRTRTCCVRSAWCPSSAAMTFGTSR